MKIRQKTARSTRLIPPFLFVFSFLACTQSEGGLRYPGNGIPLLSKDRPIHQLNQEIAELAPGDASRVSTDGGLLFEGLTDIVISSSQPLVGSRYCLAVPVVIERGVCVISIGGVEYSVKADSVVVKGRGLEIFRYSGGAVPEIVLEVFESSSSTRLRFGDRQTEVVPVDIVAPAPIQIEFSQESTGKLGPWRWLRGYV